MWKGKLIGALIGLIIFPPIGVIVGLAIGHLFDSARKLGFGTHQNPEVQRVFFETLFRLLGHVAKSDGHISEAEVAQTEALMTRSGLTAEHRQQAIALFKEGAETSFDLQVQIQRFNSTCNSSGVLKQTLIVYLISLALADGHLDESERQIIATVATSLGMNRETLEQLIRMVGAQSHFSSRGQQQGSYGRNDTPSRNELALAYEALGVDPSISDAELKKAYRRLMSENHPDKLMGQGVPKDMIDMATERAQEIQAAHDLIRKHRKNIA